jgi:hypothetical protein
MKKLLIIVFIAIMMVGCDNNGKPLGYTYIELDSCEYIVGLNQLSHKGNCKYCEQRRKAELLEIVKLLKNK